jgi:uncharacterized GH25 family protein
VLTAIGRILGSAILLLLLPVLLGLGSATAHEFWIEPERYRLEAGDLLTADLKFGQQFKGEVYPYFRSKFLSYRLTNAGEARDVEAAEGDSPSLRLEAEPGLNIVTYHSIAESLTHEDWSVFAAYVDREGLDGILETHETRGLPPVGFTERYTRCAKSLVQVGSARPADEDRPIGMPLELVALKNPYADPALYEVPVLLLWQGRPIADVQIMIFQHNGTVTESRTRTGADGRASIPLQGGGTFLLNAVHMEAAAPQSGAEWESHWASLTFSTSPERP